jgi:RluA family pseudouridine synthase
MQMKELNMPDERIIESQVNGNYSGIRLDLYLSKRFSYHSRTSWQKEISGGKVMLNGSVALNVKRKIYPGDMIAYMPGNIPEPEVDTGYSVVFENENYLAVNKTGNLPVHPSGIFFRNTLVMLLEKRFGKKFLPVHRLDRETSGVVLLAKSASAASAAQVNLNSACKDYIAVVRGRFKESEFQVDMPIGPARDSFINKKREAYAGAPESARTHFTLMSSGETLSLVKARPVTGRLHQIRVHLQYAGYPIVGDKIYGCDEKIYLDYIKHGINPDLVRRSGFIRCALHSCSFTFSDSFEGRRIKITADVPPDMDQLIRSEGLLV